MTHWSYRQFLMEFNKISESFKAFVLTCKPLQILAMFPYLGPIFADVIISLVFFDFLRQHVPNQILLAKIVKNFFFQIRGWCKSAQPPSPSPSPHIHIETHKHRYTHAHTNTHTHTYTHIHTHTHTHTNTHTHLSQRSLKSQRTIPCKEISVNILEDSALFFFRVRKVLPPNQEVC